jgi:hypothetical protein
MLDEAEEERRRSENYLRQALATADLTERVRLLALAIYWNHHARETEADERRRGGAKR